MQAVRNFENGRLLLELADVDLGDICSIPQFVVTELGLFTEVPLGWVGFSGLV